MSKSIYRELCDNKIITNEDFFLIETCLKVSEYVSILDAGMCSKDDEKKLCELIIEQKPLFVEALNSKNKIVLSVAYDTARQVASSTYLIYNEHTKDDEIQL